MQTTDTAAYGLPRLNERAPEFNALHAKVTAMRRAGSTPPMKSS